MDAPAQTTTQNAVPLLEHDVLRTFLTIAETGSFTRAAARVFRTPSAVSMQVKRLEETLGCAVFVREPRRVRLTPEGEALQDYARRLLELNEEAVAHFVSPAVTGAVRLGTPDDIGTRMLPEVLARFARLHPSVEVNVRMGRSIDLVRLVDSGELDLTLAIAGKNSPYGRRGQVVHKEQLVWTGREDGLAGERTPLPLAVAEHGCPWRGMALAALDRSGRAHRIVYTSDHCAAQEAAMLADIAIAAFPRSLVRPPLQVLDGTPDLPAPGSYEVLLIRGAHRDKAADALADRITERFLCLGQDAPAPRAG